MATRGWALADSGVQRIALYIDRQFIGFPTLGGSRPDLVKVFPSYSTASTVGWTMLIDTTSMAAGDHELIIEVKSKAGALREFPSRAFKIVR